MMKGADNSNDKKSIGQTPGDRIFDLFAYVGIGGVANAIVSTWFGHWVHNAWTSLPKEKQSEHAAKKVHDVLYDGAESFSKPFQPLLGENKTIVKDGVKTYEGAIKHSRRLWQGGILGIGGWLALPIIKKLEDNKHNITKRIDTSLGVTQHSGASDVSETKQTWLGLIGGRTVAFLTPITAALPLVEWYRRKTGNDVMDALADFKRDKMGIKPEDFVKGMTKAKGKEWSYQIAGEAFYTALGVTILYFMSKAISRQVNQNETTPAIANGNEAAQSINQTALHADPTVHASKCKDLKDCDQPATTVSDASHIERQAESQEAALSAS